MLKQYLFINKINEIIFAVFSGTTWYAIGKYSKYLRFFYYQQNGCTRRFYEAITRQLFRSTFPLDGRPLLV